MDFAILPNCVTIASGPRLSYLIFHAVNTGWWLEVYENAYCDGVLSWVEMRGRQPLDHALIRSHDRACAVVLAYEQMAFGPIAGRMDEALAAAGCAT